MPAEAVVGKSKKSGRAGLFLRLGVSALLLFFVFRKFQWDQLGAEFQAASPAWLLAGLLCICGAVGGSAVRWWLILRGQDVIVGLRQVVALVWIGAFFNIFLLGSTGGDLVRVFYIIREAPQAKARAGISILLDRVMGMVALAAVAMGAVFSEWSLFSSHAELRRIVWSLAGILVLCLAGCAVLLWFPFGRLCMRWPALARHAGTAEDLQQAMRRFASSPILAGAVIPISIVVHVFNFAAGYCIIRALGIAMGYMTVGVVFAIVFFIIALPVSIAGHGLRESAFVLIFSFFGIGATPAVAVSLLYAALTTLFSLFGGIFYWVYKSHGAALPARAAEEVS